LARYELYEPDLGHKLRTSAHILVLGLGRAQLMAWEASSLTYLYGEENYATFTALVNGFRFQPPLATALLKPQPTSQYVYYWNRDLSERVERVLLEGARLELHYSNRNGRYLLEAEFPPLPEAQREAAYRWLSRADTLRDLARGTPLKPETLVQLQLVPAWGECKVRFSHRSQTAQELGLKFMCRALTVYPAYLPVLRGLGGEVAIRRCIETELQQREADFAAAAATLPASPAEFWAAPELPAIPLPHEVEPGAGLGAHLPPANFWKKPEDNALLADVLARVYKNIPRKISKLTVPRTW
ncbi:MAG: hypothetical protein RMK99_15920, partial [Anaerolineales bacterium]|nr:hypothetical protein [Anaerolineales bacterium]